MASNVTRDHHSLRRNLKLNGNYISNDGGDEGITVSDTGNVAMNDGTNDIFSFNVAEPALKIADDADTSDYFNIAVGASGATTMSTVDDVANAHFLLDVAGDISLDAHGSDIKLYGTGNYYGRFSMVTSSNALKLIGQTDYAVSLETAGTGDIILNPNSGITKFYLAGDTDDYASLTVAANGVTTLATFDDGGTIGHLNLAPDGDVIAKPALGSFIVQDASNDIFDFDAFNTKMRIYDDDNASDYFEITTSPYGICSITAFCGSVIPSLAEIRLLASAGVYVKDAQLQIDPTEKLYLDAGSDTYIFESSADNVQHYVGGQQFLNMGEGAGGNVIWARAACIGFTQIEEGFSDDNILNGGSGTGGTNDTQIDFRYTNKIYILVTADMDDMNLIFPAVSGNFQLLVRYDGDHDIDAWKAWQWDLSAASVANVAWPGGTEPATTNAGRDIFSFYWDNEDTTCYGVASLNFLPGS